MSGCSSIIYERERITMKTILQKKMNFSYQLAKRFKSCSTETASTEKCSFRLNIEEIFPCAELRGCNISGEEDDEPEHLLPCILIKFLKDSGKPIHIKELCSSLSKHYKFFDYIPLFEIIEQVKCIVNTNGFMRNYKMVLISNYLYLLQPDKELIGNLDLKTENEQSKKPSEVHHYPRNPLEVKIEDILACVKKMGLLTFNVHDIVQNDFFQKIIGDYQIAQKTMFTKIRFELGKHRDLFRCLNEGRWILTESIRLKDDKKKFGRIRIYYN